MSIIIPAILTNDLEDYQNMLAAVNDLVTDIQIDIADGKFVPSQTISLKDIIDIPKKPRTEVHLMVYNPGLYLDDCVKARVETVLFHLEAASDPKMVIEQARQKRLQVGIVLNPETSIDAAIPFDSQVSILQLMGVHPGFYGRPFIPETLDRLRQLRAKLRHAMLEVDGGVNAENIVKVARTGVDRIVVGSGIFKSSDPIRALQVLQKKIAT